MKKFLLLITTILASYTVQAQNSLVINEIMAANVDVVMDPSFNFGSWIELYNPTNKIYRTNSLYVTDDLSDMKKSKIIDDRTIKKGEFFTVWFDHWDGVFAPYQMKFKLDYNGGTIYVTDGSTVICSQEYPQAVGRVSYARTKDGGSDWAWTANPTPSASNSTSTFVGSAQKQLAAPEFSVDGGLFTEEFEVKITSPEGAEIWYTTGFFSCSTPSPDNPYSQKLDENGTFKIGNHSFAIRARAFKEGYLPSEVTTRTYIYKDMDYVFPIISVVTDNDYLWDYDYGIFVGNAYDYYTGENLCPNGRPGNGQSGYCNWNCDWDRPANFEYITDKNEYALNQEVDMSTCGGWSRAWGPHSFKLKAAKYYMGMNSLNYQFFTDKPNLKHKVLQIRNGGNDNHCRFKDAAIQKLVRSSGLRINTQSWQPVHIFLNGQYYTVMNMREPNNKHFAYSNFGYDTDSIDQFEISPDSGYVQKEGTADKFLEWYELSENADDEATYQEICDIVDVEEYINYMAVEMFLCPNDWGRNNVKGFRNRRDGKFHFVLFDTDSAFGNSGSPFSFLVSQKNYESDYLYGIWGVTPWYTGERVRQTNKFVCTFINMLKNDDFRTKFINTLCVISGSVFDPTRAKNMIDEMAKYMNKGMQLQGESCTSTASSLKNHISSTHQTNIINSMKSYSPLGLKSTSTSTLKLSSNIPDAEIFINDIKVPTGEFTGKVFKPIKIKAAAPEGYRFLGWYKTIGDALYSTDLELAITELTPRYVAKWEKMSDEDMIANGMNPTPIVINEVSASNDIFVNDLFKKADWIELYNKSDEDINIAGLYLTDNPKKPQKYQIPLDNIKLNTIIPAHGYKIVWCDKKEGAGDAIHADFKLEADSGYVALNCYEGSDIAYSDAIKYEYHDGTHSYGRYPDAGRNGYLMPKPSPGASNICGTDVMEFLAESSYDVPSDVESITIEEGLISIAYVGNGIVNIKSENGDINLINVVASSGAVVVEEKAGETFRTINLSALPKGMYVVKVCNTAGNTASLKFIR